METNLLINTIMEFIWTSHSKYKMNFYRLSETRVKSVINNPERVEGGIAEDTVAMMQPAGSKAHPYEIWVMLSKSRVKGQRSNVRIISAWRYPGRTKVGEPLPKEIIAELRSAIR